MIAFRDRVAQEQNLDLIVHTNEAGVSAGVTPFTYGSKKYTDIMKTQALRDAVDQHGFDACFGGARRDEEKSRAKERVYSLRDTNHRWDPKNQRPELWNLYNGAINPGEEVRVFPLSNWTELDVWQYIYQEGIEIVPLYFAATRPIVERNGMLIMVDDDRMPLAEGEEPAMRSVRFRTLGCYPLSGAIESTAAKSRDHPGDAACHPLGAAGTAHRPRRGRVDGAEEARRLLLMDGAGDSTRSATTSSTSPPGSPRTSCSSSPSRPCTGTTSSTRRPACLGTAGRR